MYSLPGRGGEFGLHCKCWPSQSLRPTHVHHGTTHKYQMVGRVEQNVHVHVFQNFYSRILIHPSIHIYTVMYMYLFRYVHVVELLSATSLASKSIREWLAQPHIASLLSTHCVQRGYPQPSSSHWESNPTTRDIP